MAYADGAAGAWGGRVALALLIGLIAFAGLSQSTAHGGSACPTPRTTLEGLRGALQPGILDRLVASPPASGGLRCLLAHAGPAPDMEASGLRAQGDGALAEATPAGSPRRLELPHTLSELIRFQERPLASVSDGHDLYVRLGEGVALLSYHLDLTKALVKMLLDAQDAPRLSEPLPDPDRQREELVLSLGGVASLAAQVDLMSGLMQYLVHNLVSSDVPLPADQEEITLTFNLQGGSTVGMSTVVQDSKLQELGADLLKRAGVRRVTVKITNGPVTSEAEFDPTNLTVQRGQLEVNFKLGSHSITSTTTFSKGEGLERQVFTLTAQVGSLDVVGQAFFASGLQEVKLKASLKGLTFSTLLTPEGFSQPSFGLDLRF